MHDQQVAVHKIHTQPQGGGKQDDQFSYLPNHQVEVNKMIRSVWLDNQPPGCSSQDLPICRSANLLNGKS